MHDVVSLIYCMHGVVVHATTPCLGSGSVNCQFIHSQSALQRTKTAILTPDIAGTTALLNWDILNATGASLPIIWIGGTNAFCEMLKIPFSLVRTREHYPICTENLLHKKLKKKQENELLLLD